MHRVTSRNVKLTLSPHLKKPAKTHLTHLTTLYIHLHICNWTHLKDMLCLWVILLKKNMFFNIFDGQSSSSFSLPASTTDLIY